LAFSFGSGDWTLPTEKRGAPPHLRVNDKLIFGPDLKARVIDCPLTRLLRIEFQGPQLEHSLYKYGQPIQYSYLKDKLSVWDQQTLFSGPPLSVEPPSATFPINWDRILRLKEKQVIIADVDHSAGISSTGDSQLDSLLPLPEWFEISPTTATKVNQAWKNGRKIIALRTLVLRSLESAWKNDMVNLGCGLTELKIDPNHEIKSVTSLLTGLHELGSSHMKIVGSFCPARLIKQGYAQAEKRGYRNHEYGDISLLDCKKVASVRISG